jgi:GntR family transcriptional regulator
VTGTRVPKYWLVKEELLRLIAEGAPGSALPTERELAERLATSRTTVRQAIAELVVEGRLERTQGSGTYIAEPKLVHVRQLTSFTEDLGPQRVQNRVLDVRCEVPSAAVAERLGLAPGERVHLVERMRIVDGDPLAHESATLVGDLPDLRAELERRGSLYATLREAYGIEVAEVEDEVQTRLADPAEAAHLDVETGHPLLLVHRLARDPDGRPVEWTRSVFRGDRFRFVARARRGR